MKKVIVFAFVIILVRSLNGVALNEMDVLPATGRSELFHNYLMEELNELSTQRKHDVEDTLASIEQLQDLQARLCQDYRMLLGSFPEKTPLNPAIVDTIIGDGYKIEKLTYESRPNHHVTANFYIPTTGSGPFPAVIVLCGHYPVGKAINLYQDLCILFATNGIAALIVDPISQGERAQIQDTDGRLLFEGQSGTAAHSRLDVGAVLSGTSVVAYELWDNLRGIDYLCTRSEVDTTMIGCTGSSGGGSQATYLIAYDNRIEVGAVNSFIMNEPTLYATIGPQTASQNLSYEGLYGIDHPSYITMFAPKPFIILAATHDFFDITATRETYAEMQLIYEKLGVPEKIGFFEYNDEHGYSQPKREVAVKWFRTWFLNDATEITEPDQTILPSDELQVTETGQVMTSFENEKSVTDLNVELANSYSADREAFWANNSKEVCLEKIKELIMLDDEYETPACESAGVIERSKFTVEKIKITSGNHVPIPGLLFVPKNISGKAPAVLYVDGRGKNTDAAEYGIIEKLYADAGNIILAIDVRGFGETTDNPSKNESKHNNNEHRNAVISAYIGKTLIGQRVEDIMKTLDIMLTMENIDPNDISIVGIDRAATAVLHAAALIPTFKDVIIRLYYHMSWLEIVADPTEPNNMTHVVPNALQYYDLPDLVNAIAPRTVTYAEEPVTRRR